MSLPMARARRKNVPSIQRSPYSRTCGHSRTESSKPSAVMSQASWSSATSQSSLTSRSSPTTRGEVLVEGLVGGHHRVHRGREPAQHPGLGAAVAVRPSSSSSMWRHSMPERGRDLVERGAAPDPQLAVLPVAEELVGVARRARPRVERRTRRPRSTSTASLVWLPAEVGVRGVGAEPVVGVVGADLVASRRAAPAAHRGTSRRAARAPAAAWSATGWRGRSSSRSPQPVRMKAE